MKAIVQTGYGAPMRVLRMQEIEPPALGAGDALVRVRATSVNTPDWITVAGVPYILRPAFGLRGPRTPVRGTDVAGVVEAVGADVSDLRPGDEVFGSSWTGTLSTRGTFAELTAVPASSLIAKPGGSASRRPRRRSCRASPRSRRRGPSARSRPTCAS